MKHLAKIIDGTNLSIISVDPRQAPRVAGHTPSGAQLEAFSPDGSCLAVRHASGLDFIAVESGETIFSTATRSRVFCFAQHEKVVALEEENCEISFRELPSGKETRRLKS